MQVQWDIPLLERSAHIVYSKLAANFHNVDYVIPSGSFNKGNREFKKLVNSILANR